MLCFKMYIVVGVALFCIVHFFAYGESLVLLLVWLSKLSVQLLNWLEGVCRSIWAVAFYFAYVETAAYHHLILLVILLK